VIFVALGLSLGVAACASESERLPEPDGIQIVSADSDRGLEVRYVEGDLAFTLEGHNDGVDVHSRIIAADGSVITETTMPADITVYGGAEMMLKVGELAAAQTDVENPELYQAAIERVVAHLADARDSYIDTHLDIALHQVLLLEALANPGVSLSATCPEHLANPTGSEFHTVDLHHQWLDAHADEVETPKLWLAICLYHDLACWASDCEPAWACGSKCTPGLECPGRCGGGCAE